MSKKNAKPLTVLVEQAELPLFQEWIDKGHTVISMAHEFEVDGIVSHKARIINPKSTHISVDKQLVVLEKSMRALKYPAKKKV